MFFSSSSGDRSYTVSFRTVDTLHSSYLLRPKDSRALLWHLIRRSWDEREKEIELLGFSDTRKEVRGGGERARKISSVSKDHRFLLDRFVPLYPSPSSNRGGESSPSFPPPSQFRPRNYPAVFNFRDEPRP